MTGVQSAKNVSFDSMPRHILNIRTVRHPSIDEAHTAESQEETDDEQVWRPQRERRLPYWYDY